MWSFLIMDHMAALALTHSYQKKPWEYVRYLLVIVG